MQRAHRDVPRDTWLYGQIHFWVPVVLHHTTYYKKHYGRTGSQIYSRSSIELRDSNFLRSSHAEQLLNAAMTTELKTIEHPGTMPAIDGHVAHFSNFREQRAGNNIGGRARCWGSDHKDHAMDAPKDMDFVQLVAGHDFTCGITPEQSVFCWGIISGYLPGLFEQITASSSANNVCGVLTDGKIYCTGHSTLPSLAPKDAAERFVQLSCSGEHCCALDSNAYPHCWGEMPTLKQIHPPNITHSQYLIAASGPGVDMSILQNVHSRAKRGDDEDFESDANAKTTDSAASDEQVAKIQYRQISVGDGVSCGITLLGAHLQCW
eukprot:gene25078-28350_t